MITIQSQYRLIRETLKSIFTNVGHKIRVLLTPVSLNVALKIQTNIIKQNK